MTFEELRSEMKAHGFEQAALNLSPRETNTKTAAEAWSCYRKFGTFRHLTGGYYAAPARFKNRPVFV